MYLKIRISTRRNEIMKRCEGGRVNRRSDERRLVDAIFPCCEKNGLVFPEHVIDKGYIICIPAGFGQVIHFGVFCL